MQVRIQNNTQFENHVMCFTGSRGKRYILLFMKVLVDPTNSRSGMGQIYIVSENTTDVKISTSKLLTKSLKQSIDTVHELELWEGHHNISQCSSK